MSRPKGKQIKLDTTLTNITSAGDSLEEFVAGLDSDISTTSAASKIVKRGTDGDIANKLYPINSSSLASKAFLNYRSKGVLSHSFDSVRGTVTAAVGKAFIIPKYLAGYTISDVDAGFGTAAGSGTSTLEVRKNGTTIMTTDITIEATETHSKTSATQPVIDTTLSTVSWGDKIDVDATAVGSAAAPC